MTLEDAQQYLDVYREHLAAADKRVIASHKRIAELEGEVEIQREAKELIFLNSEKERDALQSKIAELEKDCDDTWLSALGTADLVRVYSTGETREETIGHICSKIADHRGELSQRITEQAAQLSGLRRAAGDPVCTHQELCERLRTLFQYHKT